MKKLITSLVVAALMAAPIGCGSDSESGGSTGGVTPGADKAAPPDSDEDGTTRSEDDIQRLQGPGGEADPDAAFKEADGDGN